MTIKNIDYIITGSSSGIGKSLSENLIHQGCNILGISRSTPDINSDQYQHINCDFSKPEEVEKICLELKDYQGIKGLVNNASSFSQHSFYETQNTDIIDAITTNTLSAFSISKAISEFNSSFNIVNISSFSGLQGKEKFNGLLSYGISKSAIVTLSEYMAVELKPKGIRVNCIAPGAVKTGMLKEAFPDAWSEAAEVSDLVNMIVFLLSEKSHPTTGKVFEFENT